MRNQKRDLHPTAVELAKARAAAEAAYRAYRKAMERVEAARRRRDDAIVAEADASASVHKIAPKYGITGAAAYGMLERRRRRGNGA